MTGEDEVEIIDSAEHFAEPQNHNSQSATGPLVEVTFQKNPHQEQKYLEAEPKALGVTQIMLSLFVMSMRLVFSHEGEIISMIVFGISVFGFIAGSMAIAAQNLHLPKLKACLGVQVVMCALSVYCFIASSSLVVDSHFVHNCWQYHYSNSTSQLVVCERLSNAFEHVIGIEMLVHATQVAISTTLASYCCKVVQCCSPRTSMPMIIVNAPSAPQ